MHHFILFRIRIEITILELTTIGVFEGFQMFINNNNGFNIVVLLPEYWCKAHILLISPYQIHIGHGGSVVCSVPCVWRVTGSNPTLASTWEPWASPSLTFACSTSAC